MTHTPGLWKVGEENVGGGFNIYAGALRVAHTAIQARAFTANGRPIAEGEAKANAVLIVEAVNSFLAEDEGALKQALREARRYIERDPTSMKAEAVLSRLNNALSEIARPHGATP